MVTGVARANDAESLEWELKGTRSGSAGFLKVETRSYRMPDGQVASWDVLLGGRTVAMVAITEDGQVLLARQYRPGPGRVLLELPGGMVDDGEDVLAAASRELLEETGYSAGEMRLAGQTWLAAFAAHERYAVIATGCRLVPERERTAHKDALEFIEPVLVSMDEFRAHVAGGQLTDTDIAFMCLNRLNDVPAAATVQP
jgi:ADP-ribose pyrophosphatase